MQYDLSDAAIFGANQQRTAKAMIGRGRIVGSKGDLIMTNFKGPPDYPTWRVSWNVVISCLVMLLAVLPPWLIACGDKIAAYDSFYGWKCWGGALSAVVPFLAGAF